MSVEMARLELKREHFEDSLKRLQTQLTMRESQDAWKKRVQGEVTYTDKPFVRGVLRVTDRRIPLNGPIISGTADFVTRRIHFFNNQSPTLPIFIMIDLCIFQDSIMFCA